MKPLQYINRKLHLYLPLLLLIAIASLLVTCSGGGGGGDDSVTPSSLRFNINAAKAVLAHESVVRYQSFQQVNLLAGEEAPQRSYLIAAEATTGGTNLVAVDDVGNTWPAITSDYQISVMYSVLSPDGASLYLALDGMSLPEYAPFIIDTNCAFYRVEVADNRYRCVMEGVHLVDTGKQYAMTVSERHKPIQFDAAGNAYFLAWTFDVFCQTPDADDPQCDTLVHPGSGWRAYRADTSGSVSALTATDKNILSFIALSTGDVVLNSYLDQTTDQLEWFNTDDGTLTAINPGNGVQFYTVDDADTVSWGDWDSDIAIRFSRRNGAALEHAGLSKDLVNRTNDGLIFIDRIIVGDNGRVYVAFGDHNRLRWNEALQQNEEYSVEVVQQVMPYDPVPVVELEFADITNTDFWQWMDDGPFQVAGDHFYYIRTDNDINYGAIDSIHMVRLSDRSENTLLTTMPYDIYHWRMSGDILYFAALDITRSVMVFGSIDTIAAQQGEPSSAYLTLQDMGSFTSALSAVDDIEVIEQQVPEVDPGGFPVINAFHTAEGSTHTLTMDFSKSMNMGSVNSATALSSAAPVEFLPVWLADSLHVIPDQDGLGNFTAAPLLKESVHTLSVDGNAEDRWGNLLSSGDTVTYPLSTTFTTDCALGWCAGATDIANSALSEGGAIRHITNQNIMETYNLGVDASGHIRLEFSARNYTVSGVSVMLWDQAAYQAGGSSNYSDGLELVLNMNMQPPVDNVIFAGSGITTKSLAAPQVFNGEWRRYRLDVVGTTATLYTSEDGVSYTAVTNATANGLPDRATAGSGFLLFLRADREVMLDNLRVQPLDSAGNEVGVSLLDENFEDASGAPSLVIATDGGVGDGVGFDDDVTADYGLTSY